MELRFKDLDLNGTYTYADYLTWKFQEKLELIKGKIFKMSPAPNTFHQRVSFNITLLLGNYFKSHSCNLFVAPFDVRLLDVKKSKADKDVYNVVQPDLCVICDNKKIDERGCIGAPDLIIEILSPGNSNKEMRYKFDLYEEAGVKEYWIVNPADKTMLQFVIKNKKYIGLHPLIYEDTVTSTIFPELKFILGEVFE